MTDLEKIYNEYNSNPIEFMQKYNVNTTREISLKLMELAVSTLQLDRGKELPNDEEIHQLIKDLYYYNQWRMGSETGMPQPKNIINILNKSIEFLVDVFLIKDKFKGLTPHQLYNSEEFKDYVNNLNK